MKFIFEIMNDALEVPIELVFSGSERFGIVSSFSRYLGYEIVLNEGGLSYAVVPARCSLMRGTGYAKAVEFIFQA